MRNLCGIALLLVLMSSAASAEQLVVVEARGISLVPGTAMDSAKVLHLKPGQHVTLIAQSGATLQLDGPYDRAPGQGATKQIELTDKLAALGGGGRRFNELGTARGAEADTLPSPWLLDIARSGTVCLRDGDPHPVLWRPAVGHDDNIVIAPDDQSWRASVPWPAKADTLTLASAVPLRVGHTYIISAGGERHAISIAAVASNLTGTAMQAAWLADKGCLAQAQALTGVRR